MGVSKPAAAPRVTRRVHEETMRGRKQHGRIVREASVSGLRRARREEHRLRVLAKAGRTHRERERQRLRSGQIAAGQASMAAFGTAWSPEGSRRTCLAALEWLARGVGVVTKRGGLRVQLPSAVGVPPQVRAAPWIRVSRSLRPGPARRFSRGTVAWYVGVTAWRRAGQYFAASLGVTASTERLGTLESGLQELHREQDCIAGAVLYYTRVPEENVRAAPDDRVGALRVLDRLRQWERVYGGGGEDEGEEGEDADEMEHVHARPFQRVRSTIHILRVLCAGASARRLRTRPRRRARRRRKRTAGECRFSLRTLEREWHNAADGMNS